MPNGRGVTAVFVAAQHNKVDVLEYLIDRGADIEQAANDGTTPLWIAAREVCK
jgi:ankyrin repeat protein